MAFDPRTALSQSTRTLRILENSDHVNVQEAQLPYIHERPVGRGGYGVVDAVRDVYTGRVFARKIFHTTSKRKERARITQEFHHEAKHIRKLAQHHHMVRIHATYTTNDSLGLILSPMANEGDLAKFLDRFSDLPDEPTVARQKMTRILRQAFGCLSSGLAFMRKQQIRHKDIKPRNILIHNGRVLFTDFGLALDFSNLDTSMTTGPPERMTRRYSAPEVVLHQPRRSSADVYSLGCVFVEIYNIVVKSLDYDERMKYADCMESIRTQISAQVAQHSTASMGTLFIGPIILRMTERNPADRCTSEDILQDCLKESVYCCTLCQQPSLKAQNPSATWIDTDVDLQQSLRQYHTSPPPVSDQSPHLAMTNNITPEQPSQIPAHETGMYAVQSTTPPDAGSSGKIVCRGQCVDNHHTEWTWSKPHQDYYYYLLTKDHQILNTVWLWSQLQRTSQQAVQTVQPHHIVRAGSADGNERVKDNRNDSDTQHEILEISNEQHEDEVVDEDDDGEDNQVQQAGKPLGLSSIRDTGVSDD